MNADQKKVEFKNLRLTLYKFIIVLLVAMHFSEKYMRDLSSTLETVAGIVTGLVLIGEAIKLFESNEKDVLGNDKPKM